MMPLIITAKRTARIAEPNAKSSFCMLANATHELMFHDTIEEDNLRSNPAAQYREASYRKQTHESHGNLLTNALADHRPQPVRQDLSIVRLTRTMSALGTKRVTAMQSPQICCQRQSEKHLLGVSISHF